MAMYFQASRHHNNPGFTLIELMVVMMIAGAAIGLVAPRLIGAYDKIRAAAEEQKLVDIIETVKMRSFIRQIPYNNPTETVRNIKNCKNSYRSSKRHPS